MVSLPFLKEVASILLQPGEYNLSEICVVFPNKRARLYLSKYIGELAGKPVWAPRYLSISELMEDLSGFILADRLTILFELFEAYRIATGSPESFDRFYPYADTLVADFDEIDKYLASAGDIFSNLSGLKDLDSRFSYLSDEQVQAIRQFWNTFDPENTSEGQKTFISLWDALPGMYSGLRDRLAKKGLAYEGMAYRKVAEGITGNEKTTKQDNRKYIFVGFNALNPCEEKLFRYLRNIGMAEFFWDYDDWYTNNIMHEAGFFIRKNIREFPASKPVTHNNLTSADKRIYFLPVPSKTGQAGALPFVFEKLGIKNAGSTEHIALVLADENLLIPALYAIPESVDNLNISMGYPLLGSAVFSLVDSLYELSRNRRQISEVTFTYYYKDVISILGNPLLKSLYGENFERVRKMVVERNMVYLAKEDILPGAKEDVLFQDETGGNPCQYLLGVVEFLLRALAAPENVTGTDPVQMEILYQVYNFLTRLKDILINYTFQPDKETLFRLIRKMLRTLHIPFSGEPLSGMQLLGILETRTLDFEQVIILSMNEGIFPRSNTIPSFIPHNLRVGFGLTVPEHQDSMYAYYFYRLIQRASNVVLVYDSSTGGLLTGERSRFMQQLYYESPVPVTEISPDFPVALLPVIPIFVEKSGPVAEKLMQFTGEDARLLSPSAINEFLSCSLRFYFHQLAGLPQPDEVTEDIDARMFGNLLHKGMQILYSGLGSGIITGENLEQLLKRDDILDKALDQAFSEVLFGDKKGSTDRKIEGFNLIVRRIIKSYISNLISTDKDGGPFIIVELEQRYSCTIPLSVEGRTLSVKVGGTIDRIDRSGDRIRIIDYKTGSIKKVFSTVGSLFDGTDKYRNDAVFQVLTYAMVYHRLYPGSRVVPALCFVRGSHTGNFSYDIQYGEKKKALESYDEVGNEFESLLVTELAGLFDAHKPFSQTENHRTCQTCPYASICRREEITG